jgi:hypothetical protein
VLPRLGSSYTEDRTLPSAGPSGPGRSPRRTRCTEAIDTKLATPTGSPMVGVAGLLRLSRWWRHHDAESSGRTGDGGVSAGAENAPRAAVGTVRGDGGSIGCRSVVGADPADETAATGDSARVPGGTDPNGEVRR